MTALPRGKPHLRPRAGASAYIAASQTNPDLKAWQPAIASADAELLPELGTIVARSRDLVRNSGIAAGAEQTIVDNVVGTGLRLNAAPDWRALGLDRDAAEAWSNNVEAYWRMWADTTACDTTGRMTFADQTALVARSVFQSGAALALPLWLPEPGEPYALRLQILDPDRLCNPNHAPDRDGMRGGIEADRYGRPQAYWLRSTHPFEGFSLRSAAGEWQRIPARTEWGRARLIYCAPITRPGQTRGVPALAAVMRQFKVLGDYQSAELKAAVVNAMVALVAETPMDSEALATLFSGDSEFASLLAARGEVKPKEGMIIPLLPGERLNAVAPARPAAAFPAFTMAVMRHIAAGLNIPYELLLKDFSQTNYSSARAALLEAWRYFKSRRAWLSAHWARPVYELWLEEAISKGHVEAPNFYERRAAWSRARWIGPGRGWIDPVKEANASETRLRIGITTLEDECAEQGADWEEVAEQRAREKAKLDELGLDQAATLPDAAPGGAVEDDDQREDDADDAREDDAEDQRQRAELALESRVLDLLGGQS